MRGASAAGQLRRDRQEELVDQAAALELAVQARAALAEQGADAALLAQVAQRLGRLTKPSWRTTSTGVAVCGGSASEAVKISTRPPRR